MFSAISIIELRLVAHGFTFFVSLSAFRRLRPVSRTNFALLPPFSRDAEKRKKSKRGLAESVSIFILMMH
jgi:hypothetical protein